MKVWRVIMWATNIFLFACGGSNVEETTKIPPVTTTSYGYFRALQPKITSITNSAKAEISVSNPSITMATNRSGHKAIELGGGKYILVGGECSDVDHPLSTPSIIDVFDSNTETFTRLDTVTNVSRHWRADSLQNYCLVKLPDGKILFIGGNMPNINNALEQETVEVFDPINNTIERKLSVFDVPVSSVSHGFYLGNNKVLLLGTLFAATTGVDGVQPNPIYRGNAVLDITTWKASFINTPSYIVADSAIQLADNSVIYAGGIDTSQATKREIWKIDTSLVTTQVGNLSVPRASFGMALLLDGQVGIYGGYNITLGNVQRYQSVEILNTNNWISAPSKDLLLPRSYTTAVVLQTGYVLNAGGVDEFGLVASDELVHNHTLNISETTGNLNTARRHYSVIPLNNGRFLISGGDGMKLGSSMNTAEIYDPLVKVLVSYDTSTTVVTGTVINFTASTPDITWSVAPLTVGKNAGTITTNGVYTAPNEPVVAIITATSGALTASVMIKVL
jgi:hypothetical protein